MDEETGAQSHEVTVTCPKSQRRSARGGVRPRRPDFRAVCCALRLAATGRERGLATRPGSQGTHGAEGCAEGGVGGKRRESGLPPRPGPVRPPRPMWFPLRSDWHHELELGWPADQLDSNDDQPSRSLLKRGKNPRLESDSHFSHHRQKSPSVCKGDLGSSPYTPERPPSYYHFSKMVPGLRPHLSF